jgi:hypothetical protein
LLYDDGHMDQNGHSMHRFIVACPRKVGAAAA